MKICKKNKLSVVAASSMHEGVVVPTLMYGSETLLWNSCEKSRITAAEMYNVRGYCGIRRIYRIRNE